MLETEVWQGHAHFAGPRVRPSCPAHFWRRPPPSLSLWPHHPSLCLHLAVAPLTHVTVQPSLL